jgi:hypothetical protein
MLQPRNLTLMVRMHQVSLPPFAIRPPNPQDQIPARHQLVRAQNIQPILNINLIINHRILKRQRQHPLLLQVRLMDSRKTSRNHRHAAQESWLESGVLATGAFAVVPVADDAPSGYRVAVGFGDFRDSGDGVGGEVDSFATEGFGSGPDGALGAGEQVVGDVFEVAAVSVPWSRW